MSSPNTDPQLLSYQSPQSPMLPTGKTQVLGLDYNIASPLCYVPFGFIAAIVFLLTESRESKFVRFHAIQSLLFGAALITLTSVVSIFGVIIGKIPIIGFIFALMMIPFWVILSFGSLILMIITIVKAYQYQFYKLPIIGKYAETL